MEKQPQSDALDRALTDLYRTDTPEGYRAAWRAAVKREEQASMTIPKPKRTFWRIALPVAAALVLVVGAITAGNLIPTVVNDTFMSTREPMPGVQNTYTAKDEAGGSVQAMPVYGAQPELYEADAAAAPQGIQSSGMDSRSADAGTAADSAKQTQTAAKIVRTADLTIATTAFDADSQAVQKLVDSVDGYVASINTSGEASTRMDRVAYYSLRVPSDQLDTFLSGLEGIGRITSRYETATDMTTQYSDTALRLQTQQDKMTRLRELFKQATDVSDLLEIETEIANTQYELDSLQSSLRTIDRDVDRSAISVTLQEQSAQDTAQAVELTLWQRIGGGFEASLRGLSVFFQNLLVFLALILPALIPLALIVWLAVYLWRKKHPKPHTAATDEPAKQDQP